MSTATVPLNFARSLGSLVLLGIMLFFYVPQAPAAQVDLAWDASTSAGVAGYQLYYGLKSGSYTANVDAGNKTSYTLAGLHDGTTYYVAAKAYDAGKTTWSGFSNEVSKTTASATTAPVASFTASPTSGAAPLTVTFIDTSTGSITSRAWDLGDGTTSAATSGAKTYTNPGTYTVTLTVTGPEGSNTATKSISATTAAPVASFSATPTSGTAPLSVAFTDTSSGDITTWSWSFGDGGTSTARNPAHTYATAGTYTVSLTATGPGGTNTETQSAYITVSSTTSGGGGSNTGLVAAYNFEEASGSTVVDASGKGNTGTVSGASRITAGRFGKALSFDGTNDWVTINDSASLDLTTGMTLEAWVYPTATMSDWRSILNKEGPGGVVYFLCANSPSNQPAMGVFNGAYRDLSSGPTLVPNTWVHLAATYNGTTERLYINGIEVGNRPVSGSISVTGGVLRIGGNSIWSMFFKGRVDEVRIYNRALSATEIQTDMNRSVATSTPPVTLVGTKTIGPVADSNPKGKAEAFQTTAAATGIATSLSVYVDSASTATTLVAGLYTDKNGHPGTRLAQGTLSSPKAGSWNNVAIPATSLTAGTKYWIAVLGPSGVLQFRTAAGSTSEPSETSAQSSLKTLPRTWSTGSPSYQGPLSAYGAGY